MVVRLEELEIKVYPGEALLRGKEGEIPAQWNDCLSIYEVRCQKTHLLREQLEVLDSGGEIHRHRIRVESGEQFEAVEGIVVEW